MANNLHFEYSLSVNEKQTQQNLATFMKKTFGTDKNAKLSVPIKLDITTNLTNVDLRTIQDQIDKQFKGKLTLNATVKVDASNVARQAQAELDRISKGLSLKVGLEIDPSAMKLMLGTVDVIKTLNKEITKVKDNLKDLGKKIEININGAQINNMYEGALKTAEKIQKVNAQTTEEINDQLKATKEQLAHQKKLSEEKKKELDIEKEKQANNKKIEQSNRKIREQQLQNEKELKNIEKQITAEKKKAELLDRQAQSSKTNAKAQADATEKIEKSTKKIADLEKERADNQAFLASKREEQKQLMVNIELNNQEISQLRTKIKEMERLGKTAVTTTRKITGGTSTTARKPRKPKNSNVVQVDTSTASAPVQATVQATNAVNDLAQAEKNVTDTIKEQTETKVKSVNDQIKAQNKLAQNTVDTAKKVEEATNKTYRAQDSKRSLRMPNGRDKLYNNLVESDFASSLAGYRIHDVTSVKEQQDYQKVLLELLIKSRGVLTEFNLELQEGVALTEEQVDAITKRLELLNTEKAIALGYRGAKDKSDGKFLDKFKEWEKDPNNAKLGSELDFQAEKESKLGAVRQYVKEIDADILKLEQAIGAQIRNNTESEKEILRIEKERFENDRQKAINASRRTAEKELAEIIYKDAKTEFKGIEEMDFDTIVDVIDVQAEKLAKMAKQIKVEFIQGLSVNLDDLNAYFDKVEKSITSLQEQAKNVEDPSEINKKIASRKKNIAGLKEQVNLLFTLQALEDVKHTEMIYAEKYEEKFGSREADVMEGATKSIANPKIVNAIKTNLENFKDFVEYTQALNNHTHQTRGEVLGLIRAFEKLSTTKGATGEQWDELSKSLEKNLKLLNVEQEYVDAKAEEGRKADKERQKKENEHKETVKQGKEYIKLLQEQMKSLDRESELYKECTKSINILKQAIKDGLKGDELDEKILKVQELYSATIGKDGGNFKESNSGIKIIRKQADAEQDVTVQYEKQANALYQILKLKKEGKKVSFDINKLIDSEGHKWQEIAEQQEKSYRKMKPHMIDFEFQNIDMHTKFANGDKSNLFDPTSYMSYDEDSIKTTEDMIKVLSEFSAKAYLLSELQNKMKTHKPMQNSKANLDIANATTKAKVEEAQTMDAITAKQKEQIKNEQIHQKWLDNQEIAKQKEPYLKASKELLKRIKGTTNYKKNKDDDDFINSFKNTQRYIDALVNSSFSLQNVVDAFEQLKTYAHETFNMKNETIQKLVAPFVGIKEETKEIKQELDKTDKNMDDVAKKADQVNQATQEQAQAESKITQQVEAQAQAQSKAKDDAKATAEAMESQAKSQKTITDELHKRLVEATSEDFVSKIPSEMLNKMYQGVDIAVAKGIKLTKTKVKDIIAVADGLNQLDYSKILGERGALVASGRKKKDGVFINRTDAYKAQKEAMDKQVDELEKPLLEIFKIMEKDLKGTVDKVKKEVKKAEPKKDKVEQQVNKTKQEQNKLSQQQVQVENKVANVEEQRLKIAKEIVKARELDKEYMIDINSLVDEQGRKWQDIAKTYEKDHMKLQHDILYQAYENTDMTRVYDMGKQGDSLATGKYVNNDEWSVKLPDSEKARLLSEYEAKNELIEPIRKLVNQLEMETMNVTQEVEKQVKATEKEVTLEEKKAKLQNMIRENKELMLQDSEVQNLEKEISLIDEKTKALKAQGETAKLYENLKMAGIKGKSADLMASNILVGELQGSDYGIEDLKKFKDEQVEINSLALDRANVQMRLDQNKELVEETIAYQRELDKLNGVFEENTKVQQENTVVSDQLNESTIKGLSDLKSKLEIEKQITNTSAKATQKMSKVAEYEDSRTKVYNDTIQNYLDKAKKLKESYVGDEELARMEEERDLLQEKIVLMQKQGETFKVLKTVADMADAGKGSFNDMVLQAKMYPDKYGSTDVEKFKQEQEELAVLQKKLGTLAYDITEERDKLTTSNHYLEMASDEQRRLREYIKEKTGANEVDAISLKQDKERVEVIKDLILGLNDANRFIAGDGLSDLGLAKLEAMLQLYQGTDGLSHASFAGTGKDEKYFEHYKNNEEGLITDMATSVIPYELAKYHDLYPKLESWYKELAELAKLGDTPEYRELNKKVQSLFRTIVGTIEGVVYNLLDQPIAKVDLWDAEMIYKSADDYRKEYGMQTVDSSGMEGDKEATALESSVKASMRAITVAKQSWGEVKQKVQEVATTTQEVAQDTKEIATKTQEAQNAVKETVETRKEEAKVIKEPIEDLKTLEEYQKRYAKEQSGMAQESFDTDTNLAVYNNKFSTESIGHLESMMEMFRTKGGGVMPSYKGMALPQEVVESLGADKLNSLLAEFAIRFHKEFQKYVQDSYSRMSYAKDLAEKGESIEDDHYFQKMTKAMEEFKAKLINDAMKLIKDISKSEESVFVSDDKYDDLSDYWLMEGGKGHDVSMSSTDVWVHALSQTEYLADQEKELQAILQTQTTTKKQLVKVINEEAKQVENVKQEVEEVKQEVETTGAKWKETYVHLSRVVEASDEFKKANLGALEAWDEIKANTESYELDEQWKEAVDAIKEYAEEMEIVLEDEEKLYQQRQQENAKTSLADTAVGEKKSADGKKLDKNGVEKDTKAKQENTKATNENTKAKQENTKAKQENIKAEKNSENATKKSTKAKKESSQAIQEMISIPKSTITGDYMRATLDAIKKVSKNNTFKKNADANLVKELADLSTEANTNKSSSKANIEYWESIIKRLKDIGGRGHIQESTIDNMLLPKIGGTMPLAKANKAVKEKAQAGATPTVTKDEADNAKKVETSVQNTAKATKDVKQNIEETTESLEDLKDIIVSDADINALFDGKDESDEDKLKTLREQAIKDAEANKEYAKQLEEQEKAENKKAESSEKVVEAKKEEVKITQEVKSELQDIVNAKVQESKLENQIVDKKEEEQNIVDDIADTQKEVIVISQQVQEIDEEKLNAMKEELANREKMKAEQQAGLNIIKDEIKLAEKKDKELSKSIKQQETLINKEQEKIAKMQDSEESARIANEERMKERAELEAHIKLLQQQAEEKRNNIALLESEFEETEDNTIKVKLLTEEYDKLQAEIRETEELVDDLSDAYYKQQEEARKANNEASQKMIDEYMAQLEKQEEARRKERAKYLPAISGEVGEYKGGGGGNVPPSGGGISPDDNDIDLDERIKLRQRELMLSLQQAVYNKELNDEQKMGVQILAEQILEIGQLTSSMKDLTWLSQNFRENLKEFKFSIKVDEDNKKELARIAEEERKELTNMYAGLFDEIDANEKLKAEKQSLEELIALYKEKTLAQVDEYSAKNSNYVDSNRVSELRTMIQYMEQNISSAGEYEQIVRNIGNVFRELKFDTNQTKQWYKMEENAEKARVAKEKEAEAQDKLNKELEEHIRIKKEQAQLYAKEILASSTMRKATEEERQEMERLITQYNITGSSVKEVNQYYAEMQRTVKNMKLDVMNRQLMEQDTWLDKVKNGIKDYVRFTLDLDDIQGVMQNVTRLFQSSFEHIKVLDEAYTNINQTMSVTTEEFESMAQTAYEVGDASGALGTDILEMMKIYANANETAESVNAKIAGTTAFQNVSGLSGTDATNALQTIINQFKLVESGAYSSADAITYVGDAITGVAYNLSKDEGDAMQEIISAVEDAGSVIAQAGGSLEWYSAVTGTLAETVNATGSEVGGAMRMITARTLQQKEAFDELNDSGEETEVAMANAEKALTNLGISIRGSDGDLRSIEEVLGDVASKWQTLSDSDQQFVAEKLAGTNRRSYFMALMENYQRVIDLQDMSMQSEGVMMEASEKHAESLTGKLNQLTNAKEKFYQTILNSDALKVGTQGLTNLLNSVTKVVEYMDGKWITAIGGATGALIAFKMAKDGLTFGDFIKGLGTTILKFAGLEAGAITATGALTALKSVLLGIAGGAVLAVITGSIVALVNSMKSAEEQIEETRTALENYKTTMAEVENDSASLQGMQMKVDAMNDLNASLEEQARLAREVNDELASHSDSYGSIEHILRNENIALQDRLDLLDKEIEKRGEIARQTALEALNGKDMFGFGDNVYDNLVEDLDPVMGEFLNAQNGINKASLGGLFAPSTEQIDNYYELWEDAESRLQAIYEQGAEQYSLAQKYFEEGIINEEDMAHQTELYEQFVDDLLLQVQRVSGETGSSIALDMFDFGDPLNPQADNTQSLQEQNAYYVEQVELLETLKGLYNDVQDGMSGTELSNVFNSDVMKDFTGDITKTDDVMAHLGQKIAETENELDALGATSANVFNEQEKDVAELQKEYIDACKAIEDIEGYIEQISEEGGVSADMMATLFDSGLLEGYTGALNDAGAVQEYLTSKIAESETVARQAYLNMMKDDADFWAQKMANSEEWRDHENTVQQDIIGIMANSLGVQAEDFSSFIDSKGGMRAVDYTNASTMAEAENTMQSSLATQVLGYASQLINSKAGYRQTDMSNVNEFLNSQGVAEAKTVQELATMWAEFYNAKVQAINNTMSEIEGQIASGWTDDQIKAMDGWFGDGSLRAKQTQLNKLQNDIKKLAATNLTMTNFFAGLDTYFNGAGGGVSQNTVGGGKIGGGGGGNSWKPTSTGGSGYKPSGGSGGSGGGSGYKPSSGSGGSGGKGGSGSGSSDSSEKDVEDLELETDRYYELNDAINDLNNQMDMLRAKRESITTKKDYKKSIQDEVALINQQIQAYKDLQKEQQKERNEIKKTLSKNGFKFNKDGDISNYEEQLKKLQDKANKKTGQAKEDAIEQVQTLIDLIDRYNELHNEAIPETSLEVQNLQQEIADLNTDLAENLKDIEDLADVYFTLNRRIEKVNDALDMNRALQEYATDEEKISLMEDEIELLERQQKLLKENKVKAEEEAKSIRKQLKELGVAFDEEGNITNYDALLKSLQNYANSLVGDAQQDAIDEVEELKELIDQYVALTEDTLPDLDLEWQNIANTIEGIEKDMQDMYREQQEEAVQTQKDIADAYSYYLKKRYDELKESLKKEQEIYNKAYEEENFQRGLSDQQQVLDELAQQIAIYERDTSEAGKVKLAQLKKEYEEQQKAINDMIRDNEHEKANENFNDVTESLDQELEDLLSPEKLVKVVNDAIASGFITIGDEVTTLNSLMTTWMDETGDGLYALGDILKTELIDQLANAQQILKDMGLTGAGRSIGLSSTSLIEKALSTGVSDSKSANVEFTAPLLYVEGNVDDGNIGDLLEKLDDVKEEIYATIAKNLQLK